MTDLVTTNSPAPPSIVAGTDQVLAAFERAIRDPEVDVSKMRSIMDMHRQIREEKAEEEFADALVRVKSELPKIVKDAKNDQTNSSYARLETIAAVIDPIIAQHGISLSFGMADSPLPNHYRIVCEIRRKGYKKKEFVDIPVDAAGPKVNQNKSLTHAAGSTLSYGRRYLKLMIFDIALQNEDDDGNGGRNNRPHPRVDDPRPAGKTEALRSTITDQQIAKIRSALSFAEWSEDDFLKDINVPSLGSIYADMFGQALKIVLQRSVTNVH